MSEPTPVTITLRHYQALCGLALAAMFLLQWQQEVPLFVNLLLLFIGTVGILQFNRVSPIAILMALAGGQLFEQYQQNEFFLPAYRPLNPATSLLCVATLTYLIGHYRLRGLWFGVLPSDARQPSALAQARSVETLTAAELASLIIPIPLCALLADFVAFVLKQHWTVIGLPPRWKQFLMIAWFILFVLFAAAHGFRYWRRLQMDRTTAQLLLQDLLWNETRGEQRRVNRWIVWKKLRNKID